MESQVSPQSGVEPVRGHWMTLLTRPECHLCDEARAVVVRVAEETGAGWEEQSIAGDPELTERFGEEIPVLMVDGVQRDFWRIDEQRLRRLLAR